MNDDADSMKLDLDRVETRLSFSFERTFELPMPDVGTASCAAAVEAVVARSANRYTVDARVMGNVRAECHRCLAPFEMPVDTSFTVVVNRGEASSPVEEEQGDDVVSVPFTGEAAFDLFPRVREAVILEIPIKLLCREECRGVCVKCGANLNAGECGCDTRTGDPRWGALKKFLNRENKT
jgi:uncharacterized protein